MSQFAWRLVHPTQSWDRAAAEAASHDGLFHWAGERVVYAWSQSELSAFTHTFLCGGIAPQEMLREKLRLPNSNRIVNLGESETITRNLLKELVKANLLGAWVPSSLATNGYALVMNPAHEQFPDIKVADSRLITPTRLASAQHNSLQES